MHHPQRGTGSTRIGRISRLALALAAGLPLAACASTGGLSSTATASAPEFDYKGWDAYLGGADSSQYSSLDQVTKANVTQLKVAWTFPTGEGPPPSFNPIKLGDTLYIVQANKLIALDPASGAQKWSRTYEGRAIGSRGINSWTSADGSDRRLLFLLDGMLIAVNATDGAIIPSFGTAGKVDIRVGLPVDISKIRPLQTNNPGRIYKDTIIMSLPAEAYDFASAPANIHAYDVRTGALKWTFDTVPQKGEFGYDTWPAKDHEKVGGVHNWSESTIDVNTGIAYIPTGTARYDFYGGNREGDNLFANSVVALDAETGKRLWHFQTIHHDVWDWDIPQAPKMMTIHKDGKNVPILIQATKQGWVYVFDRRTGEPIWPVVETPVPASTAPGEKTAPTQPIPSWPKPFARQSFTEAEINPYVPVADQEKIREKLRIGHSDSVFTPPSLAGTVTLPGHNGGTNWGGSAVDPVEKRFFVVSKQIPTFNKLTLDKRPEALAAMPNGGGAVQPYKSAVDFMLQSNGLPAINPPWSTITAYNMESGEIIWQVPNGEVTKLVEQGIRDTGSTAPRGGPVATASGLLFVGTSSDRKFRARDAATGKVVWEFDLPAASEGVPAIYEVNGRQYIVIAVGGDGLFPPSLGQTPPGPSQYMAFALPEGTK